MAGYRPEPRGGPGFRTDIVEVYLFRRLEGGGGHGGNELELLQLLRAGAPMDETWQPVMAHVEAGERAWACALREIEEEVGLARADPALRGFWALEQVWPYYLADLDCIVASPRFAAEVARQWEPTLNEEHSAHRWIVCPQHAGLPAAEFFMWPGQKHAVEELLDVIARPHAPAHERLRIDPRRIP